MFFSFFFVNFIFKAITTFDNIYIGYTNALYLHMAYEMNGSMIILFLLRMLKDKKRLMSVENYEDFLDKYGIQMAEDDSNDSSGNWPNEETIRQLK